MKLNNYFNIGDKVTCVNDLDFKINSCYLLNTKTPQKDISYTVRGITSCGNGIYLEEIVNFKWIKSGEDGDIVDGMEIGFHSNRFLPK
jgi:hypothetical protein